ncbi:DHS-like NAD/FAD-binding domain-containing protein, partial [Thamnocephalis sphaerospora]
GIPDFRSPGTGLYDNLKRYDLPYAEAIFDIDYFAKKPEPFYALAKELYPGNFKPTISHYFIRLLAKRGMLLRQFTQNIDTLERRAGLDDDQIVEAHGSFHTASCVDCRDPADIEWVKERIFAGAIPQCRACSGPVKPNIVFFGEPLPSRFHTLAQEDFKKCDLLIVMGTSLKVQPFCSLMDRVSQRTPRLLINREAVGVGSNSTRGFDFNGERQKYRRDALFLGSCDDGCLQLAKLLGFEDELLELHRTEHHRLDQEMRAARDNHTDSSSGAEDALAEALERVKLSL